MEVEKIGVVGAGTMGAGIAQVAAAAGFQVILQDLSWEFLGKGEKTIQRNLERMVQKGRISLQEGENIKGRISTTLDLSQLKDAHLVIEAIVEDIEAKKDLFKTLDRILSQEVVLASNTSGLSITQMASATTRPHKVVGMHFFNPVPVMKLVEVVKGTDTHNETVQLVKALAIKMGKEPIEVKEAPLFIVNRILVPMINEAIFVYMEGVASAEDIDKGMKLGANHPLGPLALADLIGLDVLLNVQETLYQETGDSKYRSCPLLKKMVRAGHLGKKTGKGFYKY